MKKKFLTLMLVVGLVATSVFALTGCNKKSDWDYIQSNGKFVLGYTEFAPIAYQKDGKLIGFDIEVAEAVAKKLGVTVEFQKINWDTKEVELNSKTIDCIWNGMTITDKRKASMEISDPYLNNKQVAVVKKDSAYTDLNSLKGANMVAEKGSAGVDAIVGNDTIKNNNLTKLDKQIDIFLNIKNGSADAGVMDSVMANYYCSLPEYSEFKVLNAASLSTEQYGIGFRKGDVTFKAKVDEAIKALTEDGTINAIAKKYGLEADLVK